jgi:hypothetical protein
VLIDAVSKTLKRYLLAAYPETTEWVEIASPPAETGESWPTSKLVLFLYAIDEESHLRNVGLRRTADGFEQPPLHLVLHYLVTFSSANHEEAQKRLERVLAAFHARPRLTAADLEPELVPVVDSLTVRLRTMTTEELNRIWTALNQSMRLSLFYEVGVAPIPPLEVRRTAPVRELLDYEAPV